MSLNKTIAKIPFLVLYAILLFLIIWDFLFTYISIKNNPNMSEGNPVNAFFMNLFGLGYFIYSIPIIIIALYFAIKITAKFASKIEKTRKDINLQNHITMMAICLAAPNVLRMISIVIFDKVLIKNWSMAKSFLSGFTLMIIYVILTEFLSKEKKPIKLK